MWPFIYENAANNLKVATYGVTIILAFSAACLFIHLRAQRHGFNPDHLVHSYVAAIVGGIIGARVFTAFTVDIATTLSNPTSLFSMNGLDVLWGRTGWSPRHDYRCTPRRISFMDLLRPRRTSPHHWAHHRTHGMFFRWMLSRITRGPK